MKYVGTITGCLTTTKHNKVQTMHISNALEILQSCTKPSIYFRVRCDYFFYLFICDALPVLSNACTSVCLSFVVISSDNIRSVWSRISTTDKGIMWEIWNYVWVTVNTDCFVTREAIRQWFSRVTKSRVKIFAELPHKLKKKIGIHDNPYII